MHRSLLVLGSSLIACLAVAHCGNDDAVVATGDAGTADGATTGTDATTPGTDGGGGLVARTTGPVDPDVAARAAVVLASCITERGADSVLEQIYARVRNGTLDDYGGWAACIDQKRNGCQAIKDCFGLTADLTGPCSDSCDGNTSIGCDDQLKVHVDCSVLGETCNAGRCSGSGAACDPASFVRRCSDDGRVVNCSEKVESPGPKCADYGLRCNDSQCTGPDGACHSVSGSGTQIIFEATKCEGPTLVACAGGGLAKLDCGLLVKSATCQTGEASGSGVPATAFCGLATQCVPGQAPAGCDGDAVPVCNGGRIDKIDCKTLGFTSCSNVGSYAVCGPSLKTEAFAKQDGGR